MGYPSEMKQRAAELRRAGLSYSQIGAELGIAKGTLSTWLGRNPYQPSDGKKQHAHLARIRVLSAESKRKIRQDWIRRSHDAGAIVARRLPLANAAVRKSLLAMLYWAEGTKSSRASGVIFVNTDPQLMKLYLSLLRRAYDIDESRLRVRLHLHHYHKHRDALRFWSGLLAVPTSQFGKIYVKKRSKHKRFRKNFQGICFVRYFDSKIREELLALGRAIAEKAWLS